MRPYSSTVSAKRTNVRMHLWKLKKFWIPNVSLRGEQMCVTRFSLIVCSIVVGSIYNPYLGCTVIFLDPKNGLLGLCIYAYAILQRKKNSSSGITIKFREKIKFYISSVPSSWQWFTPNRKMEALPIFALLQG